MQKLVFRGGVNVSKRQDKDQVGVAFRLAKHTRGQNYKDLNEELKDKWYRRAGLFIALAGSIEKAEGFLDFVEGKDMIN